jgi:hypothetical protein
LSHDGSTFQNDIDKDDKYSTYSIGTHGQAQVDPSIVGEMFLYYMVNSTSPSNEMIPKMKRPLIFVFAN